MSNEKLARQWAESRNPNSLSEDARAAREYILATTTKPTMADVEWDDKHFLAGATLDTEESAEEMVMCGFTRDGEIYVVEPNPGRGKRGYWPMPGDLTPNGKRYELVEVTEHPEHLVDEDDFKDAPEGTIVASDGYLSTPLVKRYGKWCRDRIEFTAEELDAVADQLRVLRWGWGE
ncbi:hypothetical protein HMPREF3120_05450 [Corynebacterium sp. HMSC11D10]|uniref:hypothetical protein n=1 Tax=Corynebacterium sp. HMSC11D10 TaxID=1581088 RepID=UPI0008A237DC|nr:hypothetical protein [Corynebacterium sp. HMSC11D10]OFU54866.1 hypothetical protein HMPREF3120_05450 [Corynebacterium sp. HMSC11D10]